MPTSPPPVDPGPKLTAVPGQLRVEPGLSVLGGGAQWSTAEGLFAAAGPLLSAYGDVDWDNNILGPVERWPQSLKTSLSIVLASRFPMLIMWGPQLVMLYNEGYLAVTGLKHPMALGTPCETVWPEVWPFIGPMITGVKDGGRATFSEDQLLYLERNGYPEECYFTWSYCPILDESGTTGGVFVAVTETTRRLLAARRTDVVRSLADRLAVASRAGEEAVLGETLAVLGEHREDLLDTAILRCTSGRWLSAGPPVLGELTADLEGELDLARAATGPRVLQISGNRVSLVPVPTGAVQDMVLVCRLSPAVPEDEDLLGFLTMVGGTVAAGLSTAASWVAEPTR